MEQHNFDQQRVHVSAVYTRLVCSVTTLWRINQKTGHFFLGRQNPVIRIFLKIFSNLNPKLKKLAVEQVQG